ncbi:MAG: STAS domain-containing protein [Clostridia bacterium]|nr:STAS domain-containing protein [Clostridia bacterium]
MEINKIKDGEKLTVELSGRLDTTTAPDLEAELNANTEGVKELVLDFENLAYISSAGLRVLLSAQKNANKNGASMVIKNVCDEINEVFDITGFSDILTVE